MCDKSVNTYPVNKYVPGQCKTHEMCQKAID